MKGYVVCTRKLKWHPGMCKDPSMEENKVANCFVQNDFS